MTRRGPFLVMKPGRGGMEGAVWRIWGGEVRACVVGVSGGSDMAARHMGRGRSEPPPACSAIGLQKVSMGAG